MVSASKFKFAIQGEREMTTNILPREGVDHLDQKSYTFCGQILTDFEKNHGEDWTYYAIVWANNWNFLFISIIRVINEIIYNLFLFTKKTLRLLKLFSPNVHTFFNITIDNNTIYIYCWQTDKNKNWLVLKLYWKSCSIFHFMFIFYDDYISTFKWFFLCKWIFSNIFGKIFIFLFIQNYSFLNFLKYSSICKKS